MRYLWIFVLLLVATTAFAQQQAQPQVNDNRYTVAVDTTKLNAAQQMEQIAQVIEKHGTGPIEKVYRAAYRRQIANVVLIFLACVISLYFGVSFNLAVGKERRKPADEQLKEDSVNFWHQVSWVLMGLFMVLAVAGVYRWLSLDYYAIQDIAVNVASFAR